MRRLLTLVLVLAACGAPPASSPEATQAPATPEVLATPVASAPSTAIPRTEPPVLRDVAIAISPEPFPMVTSLVLRPPMGAIDVQSVQQGIGFYLMALNSARDSGAEPADHVITGAFREAVLQGLRESATPGVRRQLVLESVHIDRFLVKPWGVPALADVTATIVDRVVEGSGPDQRETGRLRLTGERLRVSDAWDHANARWFNGFPSPKAEAIRASVAQTVGSFLRFESWAPGSPKETWRAGEPTPFSAAWTQRLATMDRAQIVARSHDDVRATIERFDTFAEHASGIATVVVSGVDVRVSATGQTSRTPFERRMKAFLFGGWAPEIVDEEVAPGVWLAAGDLALHLIDVNRA